MTVLFIGWKTWDYWVNSFVSLFEKFVDYLYSSWAWRSFLWVAVKACYFKGSPFSVFSLLDLVCLKMSPTNVVANMTCSKLSCLSSRWCHFNIQQIKLMLLLSSKSFYYELATIIIIKIIVCVDTVNGYYNVNGVVQ